jgi:Ni,Fe-hydrogenase I cytochrome b subunit
VLNHITKTNEDIIEIKEMFNRYGDEVIPIGIKPPKTSYMKKTKVRTNKNKKFYFMTGYLEESFETPFELFITTNHYERNDVTQSLIEKMGTFLIDKGVNSDVVKKLKDKADTQSQNNIDRVARFISMAMRHNVKIADIVVILDEYTENISSLIYHIKKHLESLIGDNTIVDNEKCPECGNNIIYVGGCKQCSDTSCGWSKC